MRPARILAVLLLALPMLAAGQEPEENFATPRAAVAFFLDQGAQGEYERASRALDLTQVEASGDEFAPLAARRLYELLVALDLPDLDLIPEQPDSPYSLVEVIGPGGGTIGQILLTADEAGEWRFSAGTVEDVGRFWDAVVAPTQLVEPPEPADGPEQEAPRSYLSSPRATMRTFLESMNEGDISRAVETLDLSSIPALEREEEGPRLANRLWAILNRTKVVNLENIPNRNSGVPFVFFEYGDAGSITITHSGSNWRFSSETIEALPAIWEVKRDDPVIEGLQDVDEFAFDPHGWLKARVPDSYQRSFLGMAMWQWLGLPLLVLAAWIVGSVVRLIARTLIGLRVRFAKDLIDERTLRRFGKGVSLVVAVWLVRWGLPFLGLSDWLHQPLLLVIKIVTTYAFVVLAFAMWDIATAMFARRADRLNQRGEDVIVPIVSNFGKAIIVGAGLLYFVSQLGYNVMGIIAGLGIGGIVVALAAKDSIENVFGSITVLFEMPFGIGDWVQIGEIDGVVEEINVRSTRIRTFKDSVITMPNSLLIKAHVENYGLRRYRRIKLTLGLTYDTPPEKMKAYVEAVRDYLLSHEHVWKDKVLVYFNDYSESSLDVMVYTFVSAETWDLELQYREEILLAFYRIAEEVGVEFAFPTRTIVFDGKNSVGSLGVTGGGNDAGDPSRNKDDASN